MKLKLFILFLFSTFLYGASAQNAKSILDKASDAYNKAGGITANFTLDIKDNKAKTTNSFDGKASMKGDKFKIEIPEAITWFDGKTQWVYVKDTEEVNISTPTGDELQAVSPSVLFSIYKKGFNLSYKGEKTAGSKSLHEVEMIPQKKGSEYVRIVVEIDKATNIFHRIKATDKSGIENILTIKSYKTGVTLSDNTFQFSKNEYPRAEIIDLR